jgi:hypothetical protein
MGIDSAGPCGPRRPLHQEISLLPFLIASHEGELSEYSILARFISERGEESEVINISMKECFNKTVSTKKWESNNQLRPFFHGQLPSNAGLINLIDKSNMYVSR